MTFSTLLTLFVIPVLYAMFQLRADKKRDAKLARRDARAERARIRLASQNS
jgi:hypothetical protein